LSSLHCQIVQKSVGVATQLSREACKEAHPLRIHLHDGEARREPMEVRAWVFERRKISLFKTFLF
jgi:hypothetical protein